jgi:DNA-binding MarR family transcriptional regulator
VNPTDRVGEGIARWRAERPDLDTSGTEVVGRVLRLAAIFREAIATALEARGLGIGEYSVLAILRSRGGAECELAPKALAEATYLTSGGMTNLVARMERAGLVERRPDPSDGRGWIVRLCPAGRALVDAAVSDVAAVERALVDGLPERDRRLLATGLSALLLTVDRPSRLWSVADPGRA